MPHKKARRTKQVEQVGTNLKQSSDHPPTLSFGGSDTPKSALRVLNAQALRESFRKRKGVNDDSAPPQKPAKKRQRKESDDGDEKERQGLKIRPNETLTQFGRRVEEGMRPAIQAAMRTSNQVTRHANKRDAEAKTQPSSSLTTPLPKDGRRSNAVDLQPERSASPDVVPPKEFAKLSSSAPKRLNDVVMAPPQFTKLPRLEKGRRDHHDPAPQAAALPSDETVSIIAGKKGKREGVVSDAQKRMMELEREKAIQRYRELKERKLKVP